MNDKYEYNVHILYEDPEAECSLDKETYYKMNECHFNLPEGEYTVYVRKQKIASSLWADLPEGYNLIDLQDDLNFLNYDFFVSLYFQFLI